ncbi:MAG: hypothetical protein JWN69_1859 [Alphaproteobacteria bacterium]|nr:hypothetical protein [Alphaproteobacteria bacterium]
MRLAPFQPSFARRDLPDLPRSAIMVLVVVIHLLLLMMLLRLAPPPGTPKEPPVITVVELIPAARVAPETTPAAKRRSARAAVAPPAERPTATIPPAGLPAPANSIWSRVIPMTREQMASADIARFPTPPAAQTADAEGDSGTGSGGETDDSDGPGAGPNGETLYNARWYRRPTHAELSFYLPPGRQQSGWGMIACQTMPGNRVDNCLEIGQSPAGSGLAGAVRQAAWQFRVLPPRIGGRPMVGSWVRIRIDYTVTGTK